MLKTLKIDHFKLKIFLFLLVSLILNLKSAPLAPAYASNFTTSYLRLSTQQANSPLSGTVCTQPSSPGVGIENSIEVIFPSDFTVSTNIANWTTSTTNLPNGATVWPGISANANAVSGKTVSFSSSDLTANVLYCFNFSAASSTTGSVGNDKTGTITTKNSANGTLDTTTYALSIVNNNQISVTASVNSPIDTLPISLISQTSGSQFSQDSTITYKITYGSTNSVSVPLIIQAQWSEGTVGNSPSPSVKIINYVIGSATNAYGSAPAVVDSINRTITWTISSFPANLQNQTVTFNLKTTSNYTGSSKVSFTISARSISGSTVTPDQNVNQTYLYSQSVSTSIPIPTASPETQTPLSFLNIAVNSISQSETQISVTTNQAATLILNYGTNPSSLTEAVSSLAPRTENLLILSNLEPAKQYYFKVVAKSPTGKTHYSDIFTFATATVSTAPTVNSQSLIITSQNVVLLNPETRTSLSGSAKTTIVIPTSTVFEINFSLSQSTQIKSIRAIILNSRVLGASTTEKNANSNYVDLIETKPGVYTGRVLSKPDPGNYELYAKIIDFSGNISLQKIANVVIVPNFKVLEKGTNKPIEKARIFLYIYIPTTKIYEEISPEILPIDNPSFSDPNGIVNIVLPRGVYKANISAIGYDPQSVNFEIGTGYGGFPTVFLNPQPFSIKNLITYLYSSFIDALSLHAEYFRSVAKSNNLFNVLTLMGWGFFVLVAYLSFSARTHIAISAIPYFLIKKLQLLSPWHKSSVFILKFVDEKTKIPVSKAIVSILNPVTGAVLAHSKTDKMGHAYFRKPDLEKFRIFVIKKGYVSTNFDFLVENINQSGSTLDIKRDENYVKPLYEIFFAYLEGLGGILLEFILVFTLIMEGFFVFTFGFIKIAPFLFISSVNVILLFAYVYKPSVPK